MKAIRALCSLPLLAFLFLASCEQVIEIDLPEQTPQLVVNCSFKPDSMWSARVTTSTSIQDANGPQPFTNALVLIKENGLVIDTLVHDSEDVYRAVLGTMPQAGHSYSIEASAPDFTPVAGTDYVPLPVQPHTLIWQDSASVSGGSYSGEFSLQIDDPAAEENFYFLQFYTIDSQIYDLDTVLYRSTMYVQAQDPIFEFDVTSTAYFFNDVTFNGTTRTLKVLIPSDTYANHRHQVFFRIATVSESYYRYTQTLSAYVQASWNPFAEPVRMFSNMTPNMGIFAGYSQIQGVVP
jgi:hypothetical protein